DAGVNLTGVWGFGAGQGRAKIYATAQDSAKLHQAIQSGGYKATESTAFFVTGEDKPGALCETLDRIAAAGVNLDAADGIAVGGRFGAFLWPQAKDVDKVAKLLNV